MGDIAQAFNDRLTQIRKLIIANSKLPRRPMDIERLIVEKNQGFKDEIIWPLPSVW